jgi:hypothetical protein
MSRAVYTRLPFVAESGFNALFCTEDTVDRPCQVQLTEEVKQLAIENRGEKEDSGVFTSVKPAGYGCRFEFRQDGGLGNTPGPHRLIVAR